VFTRGSYITFLESPTPICSYTTQLLVFSNEDLGSFSLEPSNIKAVFGRKKSSVEIGPKNDGFGVNRGLRLRYWFCNPQKALRSAEPRRLTYFASKSVRASLSQEPPK